MYANTALTPRHGLKVAQLVVDDGWADQRRHRPLPGLLAHREALGRPLPLPRRPVHARPVLTTTPQAKMCRAFNLIELNARHWGHPTDRQMAPCWIGVFL